MSRKKILLAFCLAAPLLASACASDAKTGLQAFGRKPANGLPEQIERAADEPLRVVINEEPPLKIVEARVKVISGPQFTELTGAKTEFAAISSVPEIKFVNASGKTIKEFTIVLRNPKLQAGRSLLQRKVSVAPGETYVVKRNHFLPDGGGTAGGRPPELSGMESERYWLTFGERPDLFVTVYKVVFDDGSSWLMKEGGELR